MRPLRTIHRSRFLRRVLGLVLLGAILVGLGAAPAPGLRAQPSQSSNTVTYQAGWNLVSGLVLRLILHQGFAAKLHQPFTAKVHQDSRSD